MPPTRPSSPPTTTGGTYGGRQTFDAERSRHHDALEKYQLRLSQEEELNDLRSRHHHLLRELTQQKKRVSHRLQEEPIDDEEVRKLHLELAEIAQRLDTEKDEFTVSYRQMQHNMVQLSHEELLFVRGDSARRERARHAGIAPSPVARANAAKERARQLMASYFAFFTTHAPPVTLSQLAYADVVVARELFKFVDFNETGSVEERDLRQLCRVAFAQTTGISEEEIELVLLRAEVDVVASHVVQSFPAFFAFHQGFARILGDYIEERKRHAAERQDGSRWRAIVSSEESRNKLEEGFRRDLARAVAEAGGVAERTRLEQQRAAARHQWALTATVRTVDDARVDRHSQLRQRRAASPPTETPSPAAATKSAPVRLSPTPPTASRRRRRPASGPAEQSPAVPVAAVALMTISSPRKRSNDVPPLETIKDEFVDGVLTHGGGPLVDDPKRMERASHMFRVISGGRAAASIRDVAALLSLYATRETPPCGVHDAAKILRRCNVPNVDEGFPSDGVVTFNAFVAEVGSQLAEIALDAVAFSLMSREAKLESAWSKAARGAEHTAWFEADLLRKHHAAALVQRSVERGDTAVAFGENLQRMRGKPTSSFLTVGRTNEWRPDGHDDHSGRPPPLQRRLIMSQHPTTARAARPKSINWHSNRSAASTSRSHRESPVATSPRFAVPATLPTLPDLHHQRRQQDAELMLSLQRLLGI